jgi:hypothetical protein
VTASGQFCRRNDLPWIWFQRHWEAAGASSSVCRERPRRCTASPKTEEARKALRPRASAERLFLFG